MNQYYKKPDSKPKKDWLRYFLPVVILCYILFLIGKSAWTNYDINREIDNLQNEIVQLQDRNQEIKELNRYYQTDAYKEREARLKLGYAKPGESVIIIPQENKPQEKAVILENSTLKINQQIEQPNWKNWFGYFFE